MADQVLYMGVRGVTDLMMAPGLVNLDFADIRTVMAEMGKAMMGTGEADGENRAIRAAEAAISNPLLEDTSMAGARGLLINITGGDDMTLFEVDQAANRIREEVDEDANIIFGSAIDEALAGRVRVSVVATGIDTPVKAEEQRPRLVAVDGGAVAAPLPLSMTSHVAGMAVGMAPAPVVLPSSLRPSMPQPVATADTAAEPRGGLAELAPFAMAPRTSAGPVLGAPRPRSGLFAEPALAPEPATAPVAAEPARASLFGTVTGVFRRRPGSGAALGHDQPAGRVEPMIAAESRLEHPRASVRPVAGEEMGIEIPTFLRRQSS